MTFKDFENNHEGLVGQWVLHEFGRSYNPSLSKSVCKITKILKRGFKIEGLTRGTYDGIFSFVDGYRNNCEMAEINCCTLLTEKEMQTTIGIWNKNKRNREFREIIKGMLNEYHNGEVLEKIIEDLKNDSIQQGREDISSKSER